MQIDLSDQDAELFLLFRRYQDVFDVLEGAGVFRVRNGKAVLNFNSDGVLVDIDCTQKTYRRRAIVANIKVVV